MELNAPTLHDIACHFCVSHIAGAIIPSTRLSKILESLFHGQSITLLSLNYLQQQNLNELYQLATGQITYELFIAALDPALVAREKAAKAERQAQMADRLAREREWRIEAERKDKAEKAARIARAAAQRARSDYEREVRIAREAEWAVQCNRNREAAEAAYKTRMSEPDYTAPTARDIARHFRVNHPGAITSPFSNILDALYQGRPLAAAYLNYLKVKGFPRLYELAIGQATYESYIAGINTAESARKAAELARIEQAEAQKLQREAAEAARIARESDPAYIAIKEREAKCHKYGISNFNQLPDELMPLLNKLDSDAALSSDEYVWLKTTGKNYFTFEVRRAYHQGQAVRCVNEYKRTQDPWNVINGSGHYRKCDRPSDALQLLDQADMARFTLPKLKSALFTTRGGVMRDLGRRDESVKLGDQAHELTPKDFRPCTLLGAVHMELGNYNLAHDWYNKAIKLGATEQSVDSELKRIYAQADKAKRESIKAFLLAEDAVRFSWVNDKLVARSTNPAADE